VTVTQAHRAQPEATEPWTLDSYCGHECEVNQLGDIRSATLLSKVICTASSRDNRALRIG